MNKLSFGLVFVFLALVVGCQNTPVTPTVIPQPTSTPAPQFTHYCGDGPTQAFTLMPAESGGLVDFDPVTTQHALPDATIRTVTFTPSGHIFLGYAGKQPHNVVLFDMDQPHVEFCEAKGIGVTDHVNFIGEEPTTHDLWVATDQTNDQGGGVYRYTQGTWILYSYPQTTNLIDNRGYFGLFGVDKYSPLITTWVGLNGFNSTTQHWEDLKDMVDPEGARNIDALLFLPNGEEWYGSITHGVYRKTAQGWSHFTSEENPTFLTSDNIRKIVVDTQGLIWILADPGVSTYDPKTDQWQIVKDIPSNRGTDLQIDPYQRVWIATHDGVYMQECHTWVPVTNNGEDTLSLAFGVKNKTNAFYIATKNTLLYGNMDPARKC